MKSLLYFAPLALLGASQLFAGPVINPEVTYTSASTGLDGRDFTLGYEFTLSNSVTINALGFWDDDHISDHAVGIWDSVGNLLVSTTVLGASDPVQDGFRWDAITNFVLGPGTYVIGGQYLGDGFPDVASGVASQPGYTYVEDLQVLGSGLNFPTLSAGGYGANGILLADFSTTDGVATPEPGGASYLLLSAAMLAWPLRKRLTAAPRN